MRSLHSSSTMRWLAWLVAAHSVRMACSRLCSLTLSLCRWPSRARARWCCSRRAISCKAHADSAQSLIHGRLQLQCRSASCTEWARAATQAKVGRMEHAAAFAMAAHLQGRRRHLDLHGFNTFSALLAHPLGALTISLQTRRQAINKQDMSVLLHESCTLQTMQHRNWPWIFRSV